MPKPEPFLSNPIARARYETETNIAQVKSETRRRKWWLVVKLSILCAPWAWETTDRTKPDPLPSEDELRPVKLPIALRISEFFGGTKARDHRALEENKRQARAGLARIFYKRTLISGTEPTQGRRGEIKPEPRTADPATAPVRENIEESGDVMLAVWCGPDDESPDAPVNLPTW